LLNLDHRLGNGDPHRIHQREVRSNQASIQKSSLQYYEQASAHALEEADH